MWMAKRVPIDDSRMSMRSNAGYVFGWRVLWIACPQIIMQQKTTICIHKASDCREIYYTYIRIIKYIRISATELYRRVQWTRANASNLRGNLCEFERYFGDPNEQKCARRKCWCEASDECSGRRGCTVGASDITSGDNNLILTSK